MLTCSKLYTDFPFAHRAPNHEGHCKFIHGHNWSFQLTFIARERDLNGFVMDFGKLKDLRAKFNDCFDHTLLVNVKDPLAKSIKNFLTASQIDNLRVVDDCSCEGIAKMVWRFADLFVYERTNGRVRVSRVVVYEDTKNSATYEPEPSTPSPQPAIEAAS